MMRNFPLVYLFLFLIIIPFISAYSVYYDKGVDNKVYSQVLKFIPKDCNVRVDIVSRNNIYYNGYAWYSGRITIYDGNHLSTSDKVYVLEHELGHVCSVGNRVGSYADREVSADRWVMKL
jgi:hypothetical protein